MLVGNEKVLGLGADDEAAALPVFKFPLGALKLNGLLVGWAWAGAEVNAGGLLKKEGIEAGWLVVVFSAGLVAVEPVGVIEKKFGTFVEVDVVGPVTFSKDGAVTVIFGT